MRTLTYGALFGALLSLMAMALFGGRFALGSVTATPVAEGSVVAQIGFEASTGWMYLLAVVAGLVAGGCIAAATYAVGREAQPEAPRFPLRWVVPVAAGVAALFAYGGLRTTLLLGGETTEGVGTVSLVAMVVGMLITGAVTGAFTAAVVDRLARPETLGLGGEAWPTSPRALIGEAARAIGTPMMAMVAAGGFAVVLAEALLALEGTAAVVVFSLAAAVVLGGATLLAYRPWERRSGDATSPSP